MLTENNKKETSIQLYNAVHDEYYTTSSLSHTHAPAIVNYLCLKNLLFPLKNTHPHHPIQPIHKHLTSLQIIICQPKYKPKTSAEANQSIVPKHIH